MSAIRTVCWSSSLPAILLLCLFVTAAQASISVGDKAPDFQLGNVDGQSTVKLSEYTTEPTLLVFWLSSCPHCQKEVSLLQELFTDLDAKGMNCVGVSADTEPRDARDFVKNKNVTFPNAFAGTKEGGDVLGSYGVNDVPAIFVIDKDGTVKCRFEGETDTKLLRDAFEKLGVK